MDYSQHKGHGLFLLVIVFLAVYLLLTFYNPEWVQRTTDGERNGTNDSMVTMLWSLVISLVILFILGLLWYGFSC